ncbi:MAG: hypothetical protein IH594_10235, partial [Bacteroidales bacterium]|nr:hypothetical protein [Bacteroidales bacterium]
MNKTNLNYMKSIISAMIILLLSAGLNAQEQTWLNSELDIDTRITSLINAMTLEEKISQTANSSAAI